MATTRSTSKALSTETFGTTSPVTGSAPTVEADGLPCYDCTTVTVIVSAPAGQTLSGAGSLQAYEWSPAFAVKGGVNGRWVRVPSMDFTLATSGVRDLEAGVVVIAPFAQQNDSAMPRTQIQYVPSGVTFSGGSSGAVVTLVGSKGVLEGRGVSP